jgi:predicted dehydrogenase
MATSENKIRYAVVGAGWIAQAAFMPGVNETGNSVMTALVTGDKDKGVELGKKYNIPNIYHYDDYEEMLKSGDVDAVYLAVPNNLHLKFAKPVLEAGLHLLLEKPMAITSSECQELINIAQSNNVKMMIAYRLHFEPATLDIIDKATSGEFGDVRLFTSTFTQVVSPDNHRAKAEAHADPLYDMAPYPVNGARNIFGAEPTEVFATTVKLPNPQVNTVDEYLSVTLRFPEDRLAQFTVGYGGSLVNEYRVIGNKASILIEPGFMFNCALKQFISKDDKTEEKAFPQTDQFGGQLQYFSQCIQENSNPEPDGYEGLADIYVVEAIQASLKSGKMEPVPALNRTLGRPQLSQLRQFKAVLSPELVNAAKP